MNAKQEVLASFNQNIASLEAERNALTWVERKQYIVTCSDLPINYDGQPGVLGGMMSALRDATRFVDLRDAKAAAARTVNGLGEVGRVITLGSAYNDAIERIVDIIATLNAD